VTAGLAVPRTAPRESVLARLWRWAGRRPAAARIAAIVAFLVLWEALARALGDPLFFAPLSRTIAVFPDVLHDPDVMHAVVTTFWEVAVAFGISVVIGLAVGVPVGLHRTTNESIYPIVLLLYGIPQVTILPLVVLIFGIGPASRIAFGVTHGMFPVIISIVAGVGRMSPILETSAHSMGASRAQLFRHVIFPQMVPAFFTGMRLGMSLVLLGVLLAELYSSQGGIGQYTTAYTEAFQPAHLFGLVAILAAMAIALNETVRRAELRSSRWRD
jgi:ABC-type nitrate/sulfonate/bicarbonate transport system permease component